MFNSFRNYTQGLFLSLEFHMCTSEKPVHINCSRNITEFEQLFKKFYIVVKNNPTNSILASTLSTSQNLMKFLSVQQHINTELGTKTYEVNYHRGRDLSAPNPTNGVLMQFNFYVDDFVVTHSRNDHLLTFWVRLLSLIVLLYVGGYILTNNSLFRVHNELS